MSIKEKSQQLTAEIPAIFLCLNDERTPFIAKVLSFVIVAYALSPIDLIPDFIPILGYLDDVLLLPLLIALTIKLIPKDIWKECIEKSQSLWEDGKAKKWYYAIPIVIFWAIIIYIVLSNFL